MNYLAHIFLAQPNTESVCGNLMGDFMQGVTLDKLPEPVARGVQNHRLVDRFTDAHPEVRALKQKLSPARRRFSGVIADIVFDHLLIQHWPEYSDDNIEAFIDQAYQWILTGRHYMNPRMDRVVMLMIEENWLHSYQSLQGIETIIERIAKRIRFKNELSGAIEEISVLMDAYNHAFQHLFPELKLHVKRSGIEHADNKFRPSG